MPKNILEEVNLAIKDEVVFYEVRGFSTRHNGEQLASRATSQLRKGGPVSTCKTRLKLAKFYCSIVLKPSDLQYWCSLGGLVAACLVVLHRFQLRLSTHPARYEHYTLVRLDNH